MKFMKAEISHLDRIWEVTLQAKAQLKRSQVEQWQKGEPSYEGWKANIVSGAAWIATEDDHVLGAYVFQTGEDPAYTAIVGSWLTRQDYVSIHRVCVADSVKGQGVAGEMFAHAFTMAKKMGIFSVRIDTHPENIPMQHALKKAGFIYCGTIILRGGNEDGDLRIAFEYLIS